MKNKQYIFVCTAKDCKKNGCQKLLKSLKNDLKGRHSKSVNIIKTKCMGHCKKGPNVIVDNKMHHHVQQKDLNKLIFENDKPLVENP